VGASVGRKRRKGEIRRKKKLKRRVAARAGLVSCKDYDAAT
jgi:hypothetical protein